MKLGFIKNFAKTMNKEACGFQYLQGQFLSLNYEKLRRLFLLTHKLDNFIKDKNFKDTLSDLDKAED